ncbi:MULTISPECIES: hypothetical protein [Proteus]|uniref:hypothetical protein n=1 Tax=Proteus TaxID=583 RepID=UPI002575D006|nr:MULTISPECIES: hypothetical protein [Proteus]MDM3684852.1 hypothetical protein [Proteus mirabilis]
MNDELHTKFIDFLYKNINSILFWVIMFFILPIIFFIVTCEFFSNNIDKLGAFGSYIGGISTFFISVLTLFTLIMLYITYIKTTSFNKNQLKIAQSELEINNFNYLIEIIKNNIKNNFTIELQGDEGNIINKKIYTKSLSNFFIKILNNPEDVQGYIYETEITDFANEVLKKGTLKKNIIFYAKKYVKIENFNNLNSIYPLIKSLCIKINNCDDIEQKELLKDILITSIDSHVLFWSLALINDTSFDNFMIIPSYFIKEINFDIQNT